MAQAAKRKKSPKTLNTVGYGVLTLYASVLVLGALGVYGWTLASILPVSDEKARAQAQMGRMLFATEDRVNCRSYAFNNDTAQLMPQGIAECDQRRGGQMGASFGVFQDSFRR